MSHIVIEIIFNIIGVLTSFQCCRLGVDNLDKLVMIMKNCSVDTRSNCPQEWQSIDEFITEKVDIIDENDTLLNVVSYFIVDHELKCLM
jgi:hypothetical protein